VHTSGKVELIRHVRLCRQKVKRADAKKSKVRSTSSVRRLRSPVCTVPNNAATWRNAVVACLGPNKASCGLSTTCGEVVRGANNASVSWVRRSSFHLRCRQILHCRRRPSIEPYGLTAVNIASSRGLRLDCIPPEVGAWPWNIGILAEDARLLRQ